MADNILPSADSMADSIIGQSPRQEDLPDASSLADSIIQGAQPATPKSYVGKFADYVFSALPVGKLMAKFGQGAVQNWGSEPMGLSKESEQSLRKAGIWNDYQAGQSSTIKAYNEAWMRGAALIGDTGSRVVNSTLGGINDLIAGQGQELQDQAKRMQEDPYSSSWSPGKIFAPAIGEAGEMLQATTQGFLPELPPHAVVNEARSAGAIGEGEQGYFNTAPVTPENAEARAEAAQEAAIPVPPTETPNTDVHSVARMIDPDSFAEYEEKLKYHDELADRLASFNHEENPSIANSPEFIKTGEDFEENYNRLTELQQSIKDAYHHADSLIPEMEAIATASENIFPPDGETRSFDFKTGKVSVLPQETASESPVQPQKESGAEDSLGIEPSPVGPSVASGGGISEGEGRLRPIEGTGDTKSMGLGSSLAKQAVEKGLIEDQKELGELPQYRQVSFEDQEAKITDLLHNDYEKTKAIAMGTELPPDGIIPTLVYRAVKRAALADGDLQTILDLAHSPHLAAQVKTAAQYLRGLVEDDPTDPAAAIKVVEASREKALAKAHEQTVKELKDAMKNSTLSAEDISSMIKSIECDY